MVSRVCEEFHCVPTQALRELDRDPELVLTVMQLRAYAATKAQMDAVDDQHPAPTGHMADMVTEIEYGFFLERKARLTDDGE